MSDFPKYPKTPRFNMGCLVTEKIDGTNGVIEVGVQGEPGHEEYVVRAGSRKRWVTPDKDNFGFAAWVHTNEQKLGELLGPGLHYGEWWGKGIQRGYGMEHKTFSLFDGPGRYPAFVDTVGMALNPRAEDAPLLTMRRQLGDHAIGVVPLLYQGPLDEVLQYTSGNGDEAVRDWLLPDGSKAAPGYDKTEGVIVSLRGSGGGQRFKIVWDKG